MAEGSQPEEEEQIKKQFSKEDILSAEDVGGVLEAYRGVFKEARSYERAGLQLAVADRLHQLGNEEGSLEFTLLASQTANAENTKNSVDTFGNIASDVGKSSHKMLEASENMKNSIGRLGEGMEEFRITGGRISAAGNQIEMAARTIEQSSHRMGS